MNSTGNRNLPASIRQRLLNLSRKRHEDLQLTLTRYAAERLLYRLSRSPYADRFVLKGALLLGLWTGQLYRPTRDLDLLSCGDSSQDALAGLFQDLCATEVEPDALTFHPQSVSVTEIREAQEYGGQRVRLTATLGKAQIPLQIDVGFGDVVTPAASIVEFPTLVGLPAPRLRAYPPDTVVAEKLHAMVVLGLLNSRMKDLYDVWMMSRELGFDGHVLAQAITRTFGRRRTELPEAAPTALTQAFALQSDKARQWHAFVSRNRLTPDSGLAEVVDDLNRFLMPVLAAIAKGLDFDMLWRAGGPWVARQASQ